jgi:hypothetical protein
MSTPTLLWAVGSSADLGYHRYRGGQMIDWAGTTDTTIEADAVLYLYVVDRAVNF